MTRHSFLLIKVLLLIERVLTPESLRTATPASSTHLTGGVFVLSAVTEEVSGQQDPRNGRRAALLSQITQVARHHVDQQLQPQHAVRPAPTQSQARGQEHKPAVTMETGFWNEVKGENVKNENLN